jgi:hypothetical protein
MGSKGARLQLLLIAGALLLFVVVQVALAGPSGPSARESASLKSLNKQVRQLKGEVAALQAKQGAPAPPTGPASGDLAGAYPAPSISPPPAPTLGGLSDAITPNSCSGLTTNAWYDAAPGQDNSVGYYRDRQGRVFLQGLALQCGTPSTTIFTLPVGFRPVNGEIQPIFFSGPAASHLLITQAGTVGPTPLGPTASEFSLDGVTFRCGPSGANGCP